MVLIELPERISTGGCLGAGWFWKVSQKCGMAAPATGGGGRQGGRWLVGRMTAVTTSLLFSKPGRSEGDIGLWLVTVTTSGILIGKRIITNGLAFPVPILMGHHFHMHNNRHLLEDGGDDHAIWQRGGEVLERVHHQVHLAALQAVLQLLRMAC